MTTGDEDTAGAASWRQHTSDSVLGRGQKEALSSQGGFMNVVCRKRVENTHGEQHANHAAHRPVARKAQWERYSTGSWSSALNTRQERWGLHSRNRKPQQLTAKLFLPSRNMIKKY